MRGRFNSKKSVCLDNPIDNDTALIQATLQFGSGNAGVMFVASELGRRGLSSFALGLRSWY